MVAQGTGLEGDCIVFVHHDVLAFVFPGFERLLRSRLSPADAGPRVLLDICCGSLLHKKTGCTKKVDNMALRTTASGYFDRLGILPFGTNSPVVLRSCRQVLHHPPLVRATCPLENQVGWAGGYHHTSGNAWSALQAITGITMLLLKKLASFWSEDARLRSRVCMRSSIIHHTFAEQQSIGSRALVVYMTLV